MRARVELPFAFATVTGRTEAGFGDVVAGCEWLTAVRGRTACVDRPRRCVRHGHQPGARVV